MNMEIDTIDSGPLRGLFYFYTIREALNEDWISSVDRVSFAYYVRSSKEARKQQLPIEPEKQYQVLLQAQQNKGFKVESVLTNLKAGDKVMVTITDKDLYFDTYNQSIDQRKRLLDNADPVKKALSDKKFNDYIDDSKKKNYRLNIYFGDNPRVEYMGNSRPLKQGAKLYEILSYLSRNKNHPEDVRDFKNVVNAEIKNNRRIKGFADVDDTFRNLKKGLKVKSADGFPITCDGYTQTITWSEPK